MRLEIGKWRTAKGEPDPKLRLLRAETTRASTTHSINGKRRTHGGAKKVTLPRFTCLETKKED